MTSNRELRAAAAMHSRTATRIETRDPQCETDPIVAKQEREAAAALRAIARGGRSVSWSRKR